MLALLVADLFILLPCCSSCLLLFSLMQIIYFKIYLFAFLHAQSTLQDDDSDSQIVDADEVMLSFIFA